MNGDVRPLPKPERRIVNAKVQPLDRSPLDSGVCPICDGPLAIFSRLHVVAKGTGGDDVPENVVWGCGDGTRGCHGVLTHRGKGTHGLTYAVVAAAFVRYVKTLPLTVEYVIRKRYDGWLDDYYLGNALEAGGIA